MVHVIEVRRWRVRPADGVAGAVVREVLVRIRELMAAQAVYDRVAHRGGTPHAVVASGDQQHPAVNLLDGDLRAQHDGAAIDGPRRRAHALAASAPHHIARHVRDDAADSRIDRAEKQCELRAA